MTQARKSSQASNPLSRAKTSELPIAAFLKSRGVVLIDVTRGQSGRITWSFDLGGDDEAKLIHEYHTGGLIDAAQFYSELRNLKAMTYTS